MSAARNPRTVLPHPPSSKNSVSTDGTPFPPTQPPPTSQEKDQIFLKRSRNVYGVGGWWLCKWRRALGVIIMKYTKNSRYLNI